MPHLVTAHPPVRNTGDTRPSYSQGLGVTTTHVSHSQGHDVCMCMFSGSVMSDSLQSDKLWPASLLYPWEFQGKNSGVGCHFPLHETNSL